MKQKKFRSNKKKDLQKHKPEREPLSGSIENLLAESIKHHQQGQLTEAEVGYLKIIGVDSVHADANHLLGVIAYQRGDLETAQQLISQAIKSDPRQPQFHSNLGNILQDQERFDEAIASYEKAIAINPEFPEAHNNLGNATLACGCPEQAVASFKRALTLRPDYIEANNNLGNALKDLGHFKEAINCLRQAINLNPTYADAHHNLACALFEIGQDEEAIESCQQAIALKPDMINAWINLAVIYQKTGAKKESLSAARHTVTLAPESSEAHTALANVFLDFGLIENALSSYARAIELNPDNEEAHSNTLMSLHYAQSTTNHDLYDAATNWAAPYNQTIPEPDFSNSPEPNRKLRIGYVSADFSRHPVGFYLCNILPFHNSDKVEITCYSNSRKCDDITDKLRNTAAKWRNVNGISDEVMVEKIKEDGIDILVDLSGHTAGHRLSVFAECPAPVQVSWMGYTGTTGLTAIDYIFADTFVLPENEKTNFTETVKYLPGCYLCFDPPDLDIETVQPPVKKEGIITFGSFNNRIKITNEAIAAWSRILNAVANSRLLLKTPLLDDVDLRNSLIDQFGFHGIDKNRLLLEGRAPRAELLQAYQRVDIALDTQPFGGGVTTAEALWMGIPVISLSSPRWSGRLGETILNGVGHPELVADSPQQYHELAINLAADLPRLEKLHAELRERMETSPFCNGPAFTAKLDQAYREIWQDWCVKNKNENTLGERSSEILTSLDIKQDYAKAVDHHQNGRISEAAEIYRSILDANGDHIASLHNLGVILTGQGNPEQAVGMLNKALILKPDYARAYDSLGMALSQLGKLDECLTAFRQSLALNPDNPLTLYNIGNALKGNDLPDEAISSYREALRMSPDNFNILNNLGATLLDQNNPEEAAVHFQSVLAIAPGFAEGHFNMGNTQKNRSMFDEAIEEYIQAINLNPDYDDAWANLSMTTKLSLSTSSSNTRKQITPPPGLDPKIQLSPSLAMYEYTLGTYRPHEAEATYDKLMTLMHTEHPVSHYQEKLPGRTVALLHFGRSGTGLMHSLIDNHPEMSTLPSIYLSGYFNKGIWEELTTGDPDSLPERFASKFSVLFDATSPEPVPGAKPEGLPLIGFQEGMTAVGENRDEVLRVDREVFCTEARRLSAIIDHIDAGVFLRIVHAAYEHALGTTTDKNTIFYHIHNPGNYTFFNFLGKLSDSRLMMMIRNPVQSLESWVRQAVKENDYPILSRRITDMLFNVDRIVFRKQDSIGVRLEDLKSRPEVTMRALCKWIGVKEAPSVNAGVKIHQRPE